MIGDGLYIVLCIVVEIWRSYCALSQNAPPLLRLYACPLKCEIILHYPHIYPTCERGKLSQNNASSREAHCSIFELCTKHTFLGMETKSCSET